MNGETRLDTMTQGQVQIVPHNEGGTRWATVYYLDKQQDVQYTHTITADQVRRIAAILAERNGA